MKQRITRIGTGIKGWLGFKVSPKIKANKPVDLATLKKDQSIAYISDIVEGTGLADYEPTKGIRRYRKHPELINTYIDDIYTDKALLSERRKKK